MRQEHPGGLGLALALCAPGRAAQNAGTVLNKVRVVPLLCFRRVTVAITPFPRIEPLWITTAIRNRRR